MDHRFMAHKSIARQYGPLLPASVLVPYIERFKREHGVHGHNGRNEHGLTVVDILGESMARKLRHIVAGGTEFVGLYKAEEFLAAMGFDGYVFHTDPALRAAFETPDEEVYARAA